MNRINAKTTNTNAVENELNILANNWFIPKDKAQLFVKINEHNYYPIPTYVNSEGKIVIDDEPKAKNKELFIGTKNQFLHKRYTITYPSYNIVLEEPFATGWNPKHYVVFRNGYLLNPAVYEVVCPTLYTSYTNKCLFSRTSFLLNDWIDVFYIEHECNFKEVKFNQDVYTKCVKVKQTEPNQYVYKIPYPYHSYPKDDNMFYVFSNASKRFLTKNGVDYALDSTKSYIYVQNNAAYVTRDLSQIQPVNSGGYVERPTDGDFISLTFVFPYCTSEFDFNHDAGVGETSDLNLIRRPAIGKTGTNLKFNTFDEWELNQDSFLLLYNEEILESNTYEFIDNQTVQLLSNNKYQNSSYSNFTMIIYRELDDYTDFKPNKLLQYDMFMVVPIKVGGV